MRLCWSRGGTTRECFPRNWIHNPIRFARLARPPFLTVLTDFCINFRWDGCGKSRSPRRRRRRQRLLCRPAGGGTTSTAARKRMRLNWKETGMSSQSEIAFALTYFQSPDQRLPNICGRWSTGWQFRFELRKWSYSVCGSGYIFLISLRQTPFRIQYCSSFSGVQPCVVHDSNSQCWYRCINPRTEIRT